MSEEVKKKKLEKKERVVSAPVSVRKDKMTVTLERAQARRLRVLSMQRGVRWDWVPSLKNVVADLDRHIAAIRRMGGKKRHGKNNQEKILRQLQAQWWQRDQAKYAWRADDEHTDYRENPDYAIIVYKDLTGPMVVKTNGRATLYFGNMGQAHQNEPAPAALDDLPMLADSERRQIEAVEAERAIAREAEKKSKGAIRSARRISEASWALQMSEYLRSPNGIAEKVSE